MARPSPNNAPPTGGPSSITVAPRASWMPAAAGSWWDGTTARRAPVAAGLKIAAPVPSTNAAVAISQNGASSSTSAAPRLPTARARTVSAAIIRPFRFQRSARTPAGSAKTAAGSMRANITSPVCVGEPVSESTSSGYAIVVASEPAPDSRRPVCSRRKSRLRERGTVATAGPMVAERVGRAKSSQPTFLPIEARSRTCAISGRTTADRGAVRRMMIPERRLSQPAEEAGWDRRTPAVSAVDPLMQGVPRRAPRSLRSFLAGLARPLASRRQDDLTWVGQSMLRTTEGLAVYVFHGEATIGRDLVVTHRGPGRDRLLGGAATGVARVDWAHAVHPDDRALHRAAESYVQLSKGQPISASFRIVGMDGCTRWVNEHLVPRWEHGRLLVDGIVIDVTSQRVARTDAEQAQRRLEAVMRSANTYVWVAEVGADGEMTSVYSVAGIERIMGRGPADAGTPPPRWRSVVDDDDRDRFDAAITAAGHGHSFDIEYRLNGLDGITRIVRDQAVATLLGDGRYRLDGLVQEVTAEHEARRALGAALATAEDRAAEVEELLAETSSLHALAEAAKLAAEEHARRLAAAHAELERIGRLDSLTGLTNRRYATKVMDEALARRDRVGIAMLDVDGFKGVNDTYGHAGGDAVLIEIARRLAETRAEDLVARWGGEEFCVLLTGIEDDESLFAASERLRTAVGAEPVRLDDGSVIHITVSIGAGRPTCPDQRLERLVIAADEALYDAKRSGRNRVCLVPEAPVEVVATLPARGD